MEALKSISDLPKAQQKVLYALLRMKKPAFRTSEVFDHIKEASSGRSIGGVLGSLYRNGYLEKVSGGRDKTWKLSKDAEVARVALGQRLSEISHYWK